MEKSVSDPWRRVEGPSATRIWRLRHVDKVVRRTAVDEGDA
jgi:hypothetical protein